jgi:pimeloyl-ACP methyl ester carboxylesterase
MPTVNTDDGRRLSWRESGSGPPLLVHPGGPGCSALHFGELPELAAERTLILLDPRGTGDSDRPSDPSAYDLENYAADIEAVREALGLERLALLGHSHGGFVAMVWGGTYPDRVERLVLANTTPRFTDAIRGLRMERVALHQSQPYFQEAIGALQEQQAGKYATDDELRALYERAGSVLAPPGEDSTPVFDAFRRSGINADALKHFNQRIAGTMDLRPMLKRIEAPTLVLACEHDAFDASTDEMAGQLPNPTVTTIPGADHFAYAENPDNRAAWSRAILDFLD